MIRQDSAADDAPLADYWPQQNGALPAGGRRRAKPNTRRGEYPPVGAKRSEIAVIGTGDAGAGLRIVRVIARASGSQDRAKMNGLHIVKLCWRPVAML